MDIIIYPNDPLRSDVFCYIFGAAGTALLFSLQIPLGAVSERLERNGRNALKLVWEDAIYMIVLVFIAIIWRGIWNLDIRYLITDDRIGGWVNHVAGTFALWITQVSMECFSHVTTHADVIKWKPFPRYWPFVRGIHRSPVNSPHKGQWRGALMLSLVSSSINGWVNNGKTSHLRPIAPIMTSLECQIIDRWDVLL